MNILIAAVYSVLALFGSDLGSQTFVERIRADGADVLVSKVVTQPAVTRFECLRSASGQCYYTVFARDCTPSSASGPAAKGSGSCRNRRIERFALAKGDRRRIPAMSMSALCVSIVAEETGPDCAAQRRTAAR